MSGEVSNSARQWKMSDEILNLVRLYDFFFVQWKCFGTLAAGYFSHEINRTLNLYKFTRSATDNLSYQPR